MLAHGCLLPRLPFPRALSHHKAPPSTEAPGPRVAVRIPGLSCSVLGPTGNAPDPPPPPPLCPKQKPSKEDQGIANLIPHHAGPEGAGAGQFLQPTSGGHRPAQDQVVSLLLSSRGPSEPLLVLAMVSPAVSIPHVPAQPHPEVPAPPGWDSTSSDEEEAEWEGGSSLQSLSLRGTSEGCCVQDRTISTAGRGQTTGGQARSQRNATQPPAPHPPPPAPSPPSGPPLPLPSCSR